MTPSLPPSNDATEAAETTPLQKTLVALIPSSSASIEHQQRVFASFVLASVVIGIVCSILSWFTDPDPLRVKTASSLAVAAAVSLGAVALARTGRFRAGVLTFLVTEIATCLAIAIFQPTYTAYSAFITGAWLSAGIVLTSVFASGLAIGIAGFVSGAAMWGIFESAPRIPLGDRVHPMVLLLSVTTIVVMSSRHHATLDRLRQRELRQRNRELEELRRSLEVRVRERTRDLEDSHAELSAAYETLRASQQALLTTAKMALIGRLTAGFAHEMSSPLAAVLASLMTLEELTADYERLLASSSSTPDDHREIIRELRESLSLARQGTERSTGFLRGMKAQTRAAGPRSSQRFDVVDVITESTGLLRHAARAAHCKLDLQFPTESPHIVGDPSRLSQAVTNLVQNAIDATGERGGGTVRIAVLAREGGGVRMEVHDEGPGIPDELRARLFEPLFTTKPIGIGTGLGLAIVKDVVEVDFGGHIAIESTLGCGSTFVVEIPDRKEHPIAA